MKDSNGSAWDLHDCAMLYQIRRDRYMGENMKAAENTETIQHMDNIMKQETACTEEQSREECGCRHYKSVPRDVADRNSCRTGLWASSTGSGI